MRTASRARTIALLLSAVAPALVFTAPRAADADASGRAPVLQSNWFWYHQAEAGDGTGLETLPEPSGVPSGDLAVAYTGGTTDDSTQPSKETFLAFSLGSAKPGSSVTAFTLTLTVDNTPVVASAAPKLVACLPDRTWNNGAGASWSTKPSEQCGTAIAAAGKFDQTNNAYTFTMPALAQSWVDGSNTGVAIRPDAASKTPFQLNFKGAGTVKASFSYLSPVPTTDTIPLAPAPAPAPPPAPAGSVGGPGGTGGATLSGGGVSSGSTAPAVAPPAVPRPRLAPLPNTLGPPSAAASGLPSVGFWFAGIGLLGLLVATALVLGDSTAAGTAAGPAVRRSRLDRLIRNRRTQRASAFGRTALEN
ncbi:MAG: DNRLRE domain-containing protein [Actinomycetes bacterium]